uniref:Breast carcinoma-amplified sequence 3-like protein n=1 Tax=Bactrocera dorsalis TaxID=27457 RepID=A0A034WF64_BACDO
MSADSPRRQSRGIAAPAVVPPQVVSDRSILDSAFGFISDVTLVAQQSHTEPKDTIIWARFETAADISDPCFGIDWEMEGSAAPPLLLLLGYGLGVQVWAIPANGEAIEVLSWRHGVVSTLRVLPTPTLVRSANEHGRADESIDIYAEKRPIIALVDSSTASSQLQFCTINFVSLKTGKQVKTIKFKNVILDVLANRSSIVIVFHERIAVFDARTLEDRLSITTCYPSPGINPNPVALGQRWLAYAEQRLIPSKRSGGGWDGEGVASYTATVLNAAKSFGKGLRELGEQVAAGLTGTSSSGSISKNSSFDSITGVEAKQSGIVTIMDIETIKDYSPTSMTSATGGANEEPIIAHFVAHAEAIVAMEFDNSGMLLLTADRRGHDFHVFRIQPHPASPSLSAVHHLYVLHRGDTSAKVQNITFSLDSRWVAVSTLRGTTHVFPITPYGGQMGVRTHTSLHVVNKLSRFHRSAGLSVEGRSNSPISHSESTTFMQSLQPYHNTTLPPFPRPTIVQALAQLRQPFALGSPPGSAGLVMPGKIGVGSSSITAASQRQRHSSLSDDNGKPLSVCAIFAKSRSWLLEPPNVTREASHRMQRKSVDSLFVMAGHGALIQYDLDTKLASNIAKDKICDDTPIELEVEAKAQWNLGRRRDGSHELAPPLENDNWLIKDRNLCLLDSIRQYDELEEKNESWVSQVEIITHAGPHRRLWMGPQCVFKTYNTPSGSNLNHVDVEAVEIGVTKSTNSASAIRSHPLSMPVTAAARCSLPVLIESGSYSSVEQSPKLMDRFRHEHLDSDFAMAHGDSRLKEDLADAMRESPSVSDDRKSTCLGAVNATLATAIIENNIDIVEQSKSLSAKNLNLIGVEKKLPYHNQEETNKHDDKKEKGNMLDYIKTPDYKLLSTNTNENLFEVSDLTNNTNPSSNSLDTYFTGRASEHNTIINIDLYDDQISVSSIQSSPSLSLDGLNTNLMQFPSGGESVDDNSGIFDNINCSGKYFESSNRWTK